jgi:Meiotically up-regulated gene 113
MGRIAKYYIGYRFGNLTLKSVDEGKYRATVVCDCGNTAEFQMTALTSGNNVDCGCSMAALIYFIKVNDYIKIGRSTKKLMASRLSLVDTNCPYTPHLVRTLDGNRNTEQALHRHFKSFHHKGEWHHFTEEMLTIDPADIVGYIHKPTNLTL